MQNEALFLGEPATYWLELQQCAKEMNLTDLLRENARLRSKCSFYESRLKQMQDYQTAVEALND